MPHLSLPSINKSDPCKRTPNVMIFEVRKAGAKPNRVKRLEVRTNEVVPRD